MRIGITRPEEPLEAHQEGFCPPYESSRVLSRHLSLAECVRQPDGLPSQYELGRQKDDRRSEDRRGPGRVGDQIGSGEYEHRRAEPLITKRINNCADRGIRVCVERPQMIG